MAEYDTKKRDSWAGLGMSLLLQAAGSDRRSSWGDLDVTLLGPLTYKKLDLLESVSERTESDNLSETGDEERTRSKSSTASVPSKKRALATNSMNQGWS